MAGRLFQQIYVQAAADWGFAGRPQFGCGFIDQAKVIGAGNLLFAQLASGAQRNPESLGIPRADQSYNDALGVRLKLAFDRERRLWTSKRESSISNRGGLNAGNTLHSIEHILRECDTLLIGRVALGRQL